MIERKVICEKVEHLIIEGLSETPDGGIAQPITRYRTQIQLYDDEMPGTNKTRNSYVLLVDTDEADGFVSGDIYKLVIG